MLKYASVLSVVMLLAACQGNEPQKTATTALSVARPAPVSTQDVRKNDGGKLKPADMNVEKTTAMMGDLASPMQADVKHGKKLVRQRCSMCHYLDKAQRKVGPSLQGVYGRAPSIDGIPFATWDDAALNQWLTNPKAVKPKTRMGFPGFKKEQDRLDVIAYLKTR